MITPDLDGSDEKRLNEVALCDKISILTNKKKLGQRLTERENQELSRLNRVKASRKYRLKEKEEKQLRSLQCETDEIIDEAFYMIDDEIKELLNHIEMKRDKERQHEKRMQEWYKRENELYQTD